MSQDFAKKTPIEMRNDLAAERVIKALASRHMEGHYAAAKEDALKMALSLIPEGSSVGWGGSASVLEIGLKDRVCQGNYQVIDRDKAASKEEFVELERQCLLADVFLMGTNAVTEDGQLVNMDGVGNRVAALCFGPRNVIVVAGMNKLVHSLEDGISRVRHIAAPVNALRFPGETPCRQTGICGDCRKEDCICSQLVITRGCKPFGRIKVILVGENLGY